MSFVADQVQRIDSQLDRLPLSAAGLSVSAAATTADTGAVHVNQARITHLQNLIKSLSTSQNKKSLLSRDRIRAVLQQARIADDCSTCQQHFVSYKQTTEIERDGGEEDGEHHQHWEEERRYSVTDAVEPSYEHELEWLLLSKATAHTYGLVLNSILEQTLPLSDDIWYWDDILGSARHASIYSVQTSPLRVWAWSKAVYQDVRRRGGEGVLGREGWSQFYGLVQEVVRERSLVQVQRKVLSPLALVRNEARAKQSALKRIRLINANALGVLLGEGLSNQSSHDEGFRTPTAGAQSEDARHRWKSAVTRSIALMDIVLQEVADPHVPVDDFDNAVAARTDQDRYYQILEASDYSALSLNPAMVTERLTTILDTHLSSYQAELRARTREHGRPSGIIRYWLPATVLLVSSTTIYRIVMGHRNEIIASIRDLGRTTIDFFNNWIIEPTKKIIGTIRHDEDSEVSIMSKRSLEGDRASLERMVVDFAIQNPENGSLSEVQIAEMRQKVREGDLTPVLKAYEKDMQKPIVGAITGNLIRTLLIQIQKTKVDVEVAMAGIDSILKSQELLFGFIGLTPGVMVCIGITRYLQGTFGSRKGVRKSEASSHMMRVFRNIDRILTNAHPTKYGELFYKDHGLLLCEVHVLRQLANRIMPGRVFHDFLEELDDLVDIRTGVAKQRKVVKRMRWAYAKWL
ncbi:putative atp synthase regulation protein nca2 protein [Lasiodiplodia theobromae]|uniref:Nuclear control of ATPase protein 2 n=1 Tax=Lasiodiplodia theobromae TaxID=45133 RepID=A0A5N5DHS4_9PEZI|nr:ATP synthase regulation protein nca2 [Lasiodiplodia theobromae]KAB2576514.1 Nuclear control of ATPase protein 2 [Lasiodiplodia theobromae]KAF4546634.1 ATP synthase regulation protein nca2 [Lasiodiplodia theobromae]KAF9632045.1 putative atp synthase regulation protein nca2 protein [Lasiodiplodia theobromae]